MIPCGLCNSNDFKILFSNKESAGSLAGPQARATTDVYDDYGQIVKCRRCGLIYRNPQPDESAVATAYTNAADEGYLAEDNSRAINGHLSIHFIKKFKNQGRLLDVGCFTGHFLNAARLNFQTTGIEPSRWAADIARDQMQLNIIQGVFPQVRLPRESFEVLTMVDVLEHIANPLAALKEARALLAERGIVYIVTPNILSLSAIIMGRFWWGLRSAHLFYFSPRTLRRMLEESGFEILEMRSYGRLFTYGYWVSRLKNYPKFIFKTVEFIINRLGISDKMAYLNTFDSFEVCAIKKDADD